MKLLHQLKYFKIDSESPQLREVIPKNKIVVLQNGNGGVEVILIYIYL